MNLFNITQNYLTLANQLSEGELTPQIEIELQLNETQIKEKLVICLSTL